MSHTDFEGKGTTQSQDIPTRRIVVTDENHLPRDVAATPGGTLFSTTPGGTRLVYERAFLMHLRQSPLAKSPPNNLQIIPGITSPAKHLSPPTQSPPPTPQENGEKESERKDHEDEPQFEMDM